jgi:hypothetical protein
MSKVTIIYADNLASKIKQSEIWKDKFTKICYESEYLAQPQSERIAWVEELCEVFLDSEDSLGVMTNDYHFIRLLEHFLPEDKICILNVDTNETVGCFVDLKPNPTLTVGEYIFRCSIKKALKRE